MWLTAAGWKTPGKNWRFKWSFAMTTGAWCMLINRWGRKYAFWWREKKGEKNVSDRNLSDSSHREIKKVAKFASPHKSPNPMWYMLQKVRVETRSIWYKGREIGTILHMVWQQARFFFFFFFWQERRAGFVSVTPMMNSWENSPSRPVWTSSILQRTWAIGCWIYITNPRELSQEVKVWQMIKPAHLFKYYMKHQYIIEQIAGDGQDICLKEHSAETKNILLTIV